MGAAERKLREQEALLRQTEPISPGIAQHLADVWALAAELEHNTIVRIAGGVAHEVNNALASEHAQLSRLAAGTLSSEQREWLDAAMQCADRIGEVTRKLLMAAGECVLTQTRERANDVAEIAATRYAARGDGAAVELVKSPADPLITADKSLLLAALATLLDKTAPPGVPSVRLAISVDGNGVEFTIAALRGTDAQSDAGTQTTSTAPFAGLDFAAAAGAARQHGGTITLCRDGAGVSQATLRLPLSSKAGTPLGSPPAPLPPRATILIAEDEPQLADWMGDILRDAGYQTIIANSSATAWDAWQRHGPTIALVISDVIMPPGETGPKLVAKIRAERPLMPVVFVSGYAASELSESDMVGTVHFLPKPFTRNALLSTIAAQDNAAQASR